MGDIKTPWRVGSALQNDGSVAVFDADDNRIARIDGDHVGNKEAWRYDEAFGKAEAIVAFVNSTAAMRDGVK